MLNSSTEILLKMLDECLSGLGDIVTGALSWSLHQIEHFDGSITFSFMGFIDSPKPEDCSFDKVCEPF